VIGFTFYRIGRGPLVWVKPIWAFIGMLMVGVGFMHHFYGRHWGLGHHDFMGNLFVRLLFVLAIPLVLAYWVWVFTVRRTRCP